MSKTKEKKINIDTGMTLYDFNKQAMSKLDPLDSTTLKTKVEEMIKDLYNRNIKIYMLLCKERSDYTVFIALTIEGTENEVIETLQNRGKILSIDKLEDGNYEIWIRDPATKENFVYYFFDYSFGLIQA